MKFRLILCTVAACFALAAPSFARDLQRHATQQEPARLPQQMTSHSILGCDNGVTWSGWYQYADDRLGNVIDFGAGGTLSSVTFDHYDYANVGPYAYDLEVWDPASCTLVAGKYGLSAASSVFTNTFETVNLCGSGINVAGPMFVGIHAKSCNSPTDCYPNLVFDNQLYVACPMIISDASTAPFCGDIAPYGGPFLLRAAINECTTPARGESWGRLKSYYR